MPARVLEPAPKALLEAFDALRPELHRVIRGVEDVVEPTAPSTAVEDEVAREQFERAFEQVVREGMVGESTEIRELVFHTAIPGIVADGTGVLDLVETHVALFALLQRALVQRLGEDDRDPAARWLAAYFGGYVRDLVDIALQAGASGGPHDV